MRTAAPIECQHCSRQVVSQRPKQAKWCPTCRRLKAIVALAESTSTCMACDEKFHPHDRNRRLCPVCAEALCSDDHMLREPCRVCGDKDYGFVREELAVCYKCVGNRDKNTHEKVVRAAIKRLAQLKKEPPRTPALRWRNGRPVV